MTNPWVIEALNNLDEQSSAYKAVTAAMDNGTLVKGVAGVDRATGKLIIMKVK